MGSRIVAVGLGLILITLSTSSACFAQAAFTTVEGRFLRLISDSADEATLREYVAAYDEAVPLWAAYWQRDIRSVDGWRLTGYLMQDKAPFRAKGFIPEWLPDFPHGYQAGDKLWVMKQPSDFYTLHLLLHEGAHGFAFKFFGGCGPPWYMEGTAEYLGTHRRTDQGLEIGIIPASREASPFWGRLGLIADRRQESRIPTIETVMRYGETAHREVEAYAWSWAAALLMEMYPEYRERFRAAARGGSDASPQFTRQFFQTMRTEWPMVAAQWTLLTNDLDYGFDPSRNQTKLAMDFPPLGAAGVSLKIASDQGWQAVPAMVRAGQMLTIKAEGMYQLEDDPAWQSTAEGVTITYHRGRPLGRLIACVVPSSMADQRYLPKLEILSAGESSEWVAPATGWLLFKINDRPDSLHNNRGSLEVSVKPAGR